MYANLRVLASVLSRQTSRSELFEVALRIGNCNVQRVDRYWSVDHKTVFNTAKDAVREIRIPTAFGHIAAKEYGDPTATNRMLAVHGLMDNCGTFEKLLPYIVKANNIHVIAMDEPGCGLSSHLPVGAEIPKFSLLKEMRRVVKYMNWSNFSIIGHSKGAGFALLFACILPESVQCVIALDAFSAFFYDENTACTGFDVSNLDNILNYEEKVLKNADSEKVYSEQEVIKKLMNTTLGVTETTARILMKRGCKARDGGFVFTRDVRQRLPVIGPIATKTDYLKLAEKMRCDLLVLTTTAGPFWYFNKNEWFNTYKENCRTFQHILVEGQHYVHIDAAQQVAALINPFLNESFTKGPLKGR